MKINLKRKSSQPLVDARRKIYHHMLHQFCDEYDMDLPQAKNYFETNSKNLNVLISYLTSQGYKVSMFKLDGADEVVLSWGLEFSKECELTLALWLRYADNEEREAA